MKKYENEGKSREIALNKCLEEANASENEVITHEEEIVGGLLHKTKYKMIVVTIEDVKTEIKDFMNELSHLMNIKIVTTVKQEDSIFKVFLDSDNNSILIGKDGKTMKSIQVLLKQTILSKTGIHTKVHLDVSGYKEKKLKYLEQTIRRVAGEVSNTKIEAKLDPMNSYERRFVHNIVNEYTMLETRSEGEEPTRCIVISHKQD